MLPGKLPLVKHEKKKKNSMKIGPKLTIAKTQDKNKCYFSAVHQHKECIYAPKYRAGAQMLQ